MSIQETLRLEEKLNASFNNENDPTKAHIINCMCVATNTADTVESFAQSSDSFGELCRNYLHYVPNGIAESSIIYYLLDHFEQYIADHIILRGFNKSSNDIVLSGKQISVRIPDFTYKPYLDKYCQRSMSVTGDYYVDIVLPYVNASEYKEIQIGVGTTVTVYRDKNGEVFIVCE